MFRTSRSAATIRHALETCFSKLRPTTPTTLSSPFHTTARGAKKNRTPLPPRPAPPPEHEFTEVYLKGSGPGGQKINKTNSAVQLRHLPTGLVVKCQATRSRSENRVIARRLLADRLDALHGGAGSRAAAVGEVRRKKAASAAKKKRRKYRKLEEEKEREGGEVGAEAQQLLQQEGRPKKLDTAEGVGTAALATATAAGLAGVGREEAFEEDAFDEEDFDDEEDYEDDIEEEGGIKEEGNTRSDNQGPIDPARKKKR
jgi:hypothetical protein